LFYVNLGVTLAIHPSREHRIDPEGGSVTMPDVSSDIIIEHRLEALRADEARQNPLYGTSQGYCAIYHNDDGYWVAYRATEDGSFEGSTVSQITAEQLLRSKVQNARTVWNSWVAMGDHDTTGNQIIRCDHILYTTRPPQPNMPREWNGHGGRRFQFRMLSGETVNTVNLWHHGTIPTDYRHLLPDNASELA
jgi:hypothetical protein